MESEAGKEMQRRVWEETQDVLVGVSPEAREWYAELEA